jgi:hypothetical protein
MRRAICFSVVLVCAAIVSAACATRTAPPAAGAPDEPRVSWRVLSGPDGKREREVCRSDVEGPCVLEASSENRRKTVSVSVYLYAAGAPTAYQGVIYAGVIETVAARGYEVQVDYTIKPANRPTAVSAFGYVVSRPGPTVLRISLLANVPNHPDPRQFLREIPITVAAAATAP